MRETLSDERKSMDNLTLFECHEHEINIGTPSVHELFWNEVFYFACGEILQRLSLVSLIIFHAQIIFEFRPTDLGKKEYPTLN